VSRNGAGIGSASLTLIFAVLCLAVFSLISHTAAANDMALAKAEAALVKGYYEADALAEQLAAEVEGTGRTEFSVAVSQSRELYVILDIKEDTADILAWRIRDTGEWRPDTSLPVWPGE